MVVLPPFLMLLKGSPFFIPFFSFHFFKTILSLVVYPFETDLLLPLGSFNLLLQLLLPLLVFTSVHFILLFFLRDGLVMICRTALQVWHAFLQKKYIFVCLFDNFFSGGYQVIGGTNGPVQDIAIFDGFSDNGEVCFYYLSPFLYVFFDFFFRRMRSFLGDLFRNPLEKMKK